MKRYLIAGLLVWLPIWATILVLGFIVKVMSGTLSLIPAAYQPDVLIGVHIPGLGFLISLFLLLLTGALATNYLGRSLVGAWDRLLARIPVVRSIYSSVKQLLETLFSSQGQSFRKVLLVEYPRKGAWTLAFQTSDEIESVSSHFSEPMITIYVPTTPNPTSGFMLLVPKRETIMLDMNVDDALKLILSLGVVQPDPTRPKKLDSE